MPNVSYFFEPLWLMSGRNNIIERPISISNYLGRKTRLETKWRMGIISKQALNKTLNNVSYLPKSVTEINAQVFLIHYNPGQYTYVLST